MALNIATKLFPENKHGIMICGLNWGGDPAKNTGGEETDDDRSFFSDARVNNYPYRNRIVKWFELWGQPLETVPEKAGPFERCIVQTNWLPDQSMNVHDRHLVETYATNPENFFLHLSYFQPRLLLFMSPLLIDALNSGPCRDSAIALLGNVTAEPVFRTKKIVSRKTGKRRKAFRVGFQSFEHCEIIGLPHPTGSRGLAYDYIAAFRDDIAPKLDSIHKHFSMG